MSEMPMLAGFFGLLFATVWFGRTGSSLAVLGAAVCSNAASLTRYDGWFLIPFATLAVLLAARRRRLRYAALCGFLASLGPLYWLAHNYWFYGDPLEFYRGQYSAKAIYQRALDAGMAKYPGDGEWDKAWLYFRSAALSCAGPFLVWLAAAGGAVMLARRALLPLALLLPGPVFYLWSLHSSGTPIFVPYLWPNSWYNTRYGLAAFPLLVFAASALVMAIPERWRAFAAVVTVFLAAAPWLAYPRPDAWICWKEAQVNSEARRTWTQETAEFLRENYTPHSGILTSFGDLAGVFPRAGIALRETLHEGNDPFWTAALARPDLFLWEEWVLAIGGGRVSSAMATSGRWGVHYPLVRSITVKGGPVSEIYRRSR
jgi:hypothetical protein